MCVTLARSKPAYIISTAIHIMIADRMCKVVADPEYLSLAIGKEGQNVRLAARLTGIKIDIKAE